MATTCPAAGEALSWEAVRPLAGASAQGHRAKVHRGSLGWGEERVLGTAAQAGLLHGVNGVPQKLVCVLLVPEAEMPGDL